MTYCYLCPTCGTTMESPVRNSIAICTDGHIMRRDYRTEAVGVGAGVRVSRDGTSLDQARLFLPSNDEFKGPGDPDGTKGARQWLDSHQPKESGGHNPLLTIERKSF